ncbi:MAG: peptidoglycan editing factor PgeF [Lachnospiraceae bacterium]|nr:peptidoglycan editing factor PgeF [Lachnospiraceae bacterium]
MKSEIPKIKYLAGRERSTELVCVPGKAPFIRFIPFSDDINYAADGAGLTGRGGTCDFVVHGFSTRLGGVSEGIFSSMNFACGRGDAPENILENFRIMGDALGIAPESMVYAKQTHTANVLHVNEYHKGMGVTRDRDYTDIDALVTDTPGVCLVAGFADCIPVFFINLEKKAIGLAHSGWRGTVNDIAGATVHMMSEEFGTKAKDIIAFVGPGICGEHYEVGNDVADEFKKKYPDADKKMILREAATEEKYYLDLSLACRENLINAGVPEENVFLSDICTCCNPELLHSHRYTKGQRGGLCGFLMIK